MKLLPCLSFKFQFNYKEVLSLVLKVALQCFRSFLVTRFKCVKFIIDNNAVVVVLVLINILSN